MERQHGVVRLDDGVRHLGRRDDGEGLHDAVGVLLADLGDQEGAHAGAGAATERVDDLEALEAVADSASLRHDVEDGVDELGALGVVALGPVVARARLAEDEVVRAEELAEGAGADGVHGAGLEVHEDGARHVAAARRLVVVDVDALELEVRVAVVGARRVDAVLVGVLFWRRRRRRERAFRCSGTIFRLGGPRESLSDENRFWLNDTRSSNGDASRKGFARGRGSSARRTRSRRGSARGSQGRGRARSGSWTISARNITLARTFLRALPTLRESVEAPSHYARCADDAHRLARGHVQRRVSAGKRGGETGRGLDRARGGWCSIFEMGFFFEHPVQLPDGRERGAEEFRVLRRGTPRKLEAKGGPLDRLHGDDKTIVIPLRLSDKVRFMVEDYPVINTAARRSTRRSIVRAARGSVIMTLLVWGEDKNHMFAYNDEEYKQSLTVLRSIAKRRRRGGQFARHDSIGGQRRIDGGPSGTRRERPYLVLPRSRPRRGTGC